MIASNLYENGIITKEEAERIIAFSNCISPSFCIMLLGGEVLENYYYGAVLFITVTVSNLLCIFLLRNKFKEKDEFNIVNAPCISKNSITSIIKDSSYVMLNICAFVIFFNCIGSVLINAISLSTRLSYEIKAVISGLLEISSSIKYLDKLNFGKQMLYGIILISFGGISAIMQVISVCETHSLSYKTFIIGKVVSAVLSPVVLLIIVAIIPENLSDTSNFLSLIIPLVFIFSILYCVLYAKKQKKKEKR